MMAEQHHRINAVAERLSVSRQTVTRAFRDRQGVRYINPTGRGAKGKRRYRVMLIPESALADYLNEIEQ